MFKDLKFDRIKVISFNNLTIELCKKYNASAIIRGLRAVSDFEYEFQLAGMNKKLIQKLRLCFWCQMLKIKLFHSKFVKEIVNGGDINRFVPNTLLKC